MTLDELASAVASTSSDPVVQRLASLLVSWKVDNTSVQALRIKIERYIGNTWIERAEVHEIVYALWSAFVSRAINSIGGMTMNERMFAFGLTSEFDSASTDEQRERVYAKLHAKP